MGREYNLFSEKTKYRAIKLHKEGKSIYTIAKTLMCYRASVVSWIAEYEQEQERIKHEDTKVDNTEVWEIVREQVNAARGRGFTFHAEDNELIYWYKDPMDSTNTLVPANDAIWIAKNEKMIIEFLNQEAQTKKEEPVQVILSTKHMESHPIEIVETPQKFKRRYLSRSDKLEFKRRAVELYKELGSSKKVADIMGCSTSSVLTWAREAGYEVQKPRSQPQFDPDIEKRAVELYASGMRAEDIASEIGCAASSVLRWAKNHGIESRGLGPQIGINYHQRVRPAAIEVPGENTLTYVKTVLDNCFSMVKDALEKQPVQAPIEEAPKKRVVKERQTQENAALIKGLSLHLGISDKAIAECFGIKRENVQCITVGRSHKLINPCSVETAKAFWGNYIDCKYQ